MRQLAAAILGLGSFFAAPVLAASPPPTIGGFAISTELHTRTQSKSLDSLIHRTSPTFTWAGSDMMWVEKDAGGKPQFAMNHAYPIDSDSGVATWALFDAPSVYASSGFVDYTRTVTSGEVLSKCQDGSQLYWVKWPSRQITGTGPVAVTRNLFVLLKDGAWKFVGEGPMTIDARSDNKRVSTANTFHVEWTRSEARPIKIQATRQTTIDLLYPDPTQHFQWNREMTLSGKLPAAFQTDGKDYTVAAHETTGQMVKRLAMCDTYYPNEPDPNRKSKMLQAAALAIAELNPHLPSQLKSGAKVLLPEMENLWDYALRMAKNKPMHEQ